MNVHGAPSMDLASSRLRLSRDHLLTLARVVRGEQQPGDEQPKAELAAAELITSDGRVVDAVRPVAVAAASTLMRLEVARARGGHMRHVQVQWSPAGLLVVPAGPSERVEEMAFQHPSALARTLWRLLQLGPRPLPHKGRKVGPLSVEQLLKPFDGGEAGWLHAVSAHTDSATLDRIDLHTGPHVAPVPLALVDTPGGLWEVTSLDGTSFHLQPTSPVVIFSTFAAWQRSAMELRSTE